MKPQTQRVLITVAAIVVVVSTLATRTEDSPEKQAKDAAGCPQRRRKRSTKSMQVPDASIPPGLMAAAKAIAVFRKSSSPRRRWQAAGHRQRHVGRSEARVPPGARRQRGAQIGASSTDFLLSRTRGLMG